ncbi:MAG: TonB family protein, partial [Gemmatimonadota bacterium]
GGGTGGGTGPGTGTGRGLGTGTGGGRAMPPEPRQLILPPLEVPKELRGRSVFVTFHVDADGRVTAVDVNPPISNGGFARRFDEVMRNYRFRPARSAEGVAVPGTTVVTVIF